jgi:hypothetical protein
MTKLNEMILAVLFLSVPTLIISSCQNQEGPAEQVGKNLDKALVSVGDLMEKTGDRIKNVEKDKQK